MSVEQSSSLSPPSLPRLHTAGRWLLLLLILFAFARLTWQLDAKNLWWDESLSLQRAESGWGDLLAGRITIDDGIYQRPTVDQHPFGYFVLLRLFVYMAGQSEFVLRFPSVMASTLLLPGLWVMARFFARRGVLPGQAAPLVLFLAAGSPFYLWYGQEARMYTLVALLAVISSYLLLRWGEKAEPSIRRRRLVVYAGVTAAFLSTHYFAALLLPVHALVLVGGVRHKRKLALALVSGGLLAVAGAIASAAWLILRQPGSGSNFVSLPFSILLPDLLNAYSLGLSVNIVQVWWLDLVFGGLALLGGLWVIRRNGWQERGWLLPALVVTPILWLVLVSQIQPVYMNARHLSVISGFFLLAVAGGIGLVWQRHWVAGGLLYLLLMVGMGFSTRNYFTLPEYAKDDFAGLGDVLRQQMMPGDVLLLNPPHMLRLFRYYLPVDTISAIQSEGGSVHWWGVPTANGWTQNERVLTDLAGNYRRVWLVTSLMFPFADPERQIEGWLESHALRVREQSFYSANSILELDLFLLGGAVAQEMPPDLLPVQADFGNAIGLRGYRVGRPLWPGAVIPVTYYWRALRPLDQRYKYIARLESLPPGLAEVPIHPTEREFYDGFLPSIWWAPDALIVEESEIGAMPALFGDEAILSLQLYSATTLEKLPVVTRGAGTVRADGDSLKLPFLLFPPEFGASPKN